MDIRSYGQCAFSNNRLMELGLEAWYFQASSFLTFSFFLIPAEYSAFLQTFIFQHSS